MPNLRHFVLLNDFTWNLEPQIMQKFCNLSSLHLNFSNRQALKILAAVGPQLKVLNIHSRVDGYFNPEINPFRDLLKIFMLCPILESLRVCAFSGAIDLEVPMDVQKLKLEELNFFLSDFSNATEFLCLILAAPCLKSVTLYDPTLSNQIIESLSSLLATNSVLQNLTKIDFFLRWSWASASRDLVKHLVAFCPKLQKAHVYTWNCATLSENVPESLAPFLDLVQNI